MDELQSGDKIVDLGAMFRSVTIAGGAVSSALSLFLSQQNWKICCAGFIIGAVVGLIVGLIGSRLLYSDGEGNVKIVKVLPTNFPFTLSTALKGALLQIAVVLVGLALADKVAAWPLIIAVVVAVNFSIGVLAARLSLS